MGVLTDFYLADKLDAQKIGEHFDEFKGLDAKGIDQIRMGTLYGILSGAAYDPRFMQDDESFGYIGSEDGPWVQAVPEDMVRRLVGMSESDLERVGDEWFKTEEFKPKYSGWTRADIEEFLVDIQRMASAAIQEGKTIFMWTSL